ncbi:hypothetical protein BJ138DRAFT_1150375 [Hygrophoropsis aurantiaca]|uniref:Uncharacterized protein n=1 Tax=Hygrophoropsis aurantiaca TaxID=72124 RepID=A0ACB8AED6_9AGAM|nr:hypothetical protein BJ138DRAFT_1150375 [Hygrophoropsis aurantiaca]
MMIALRVSLSTTILTLCTLLACISAIRAKCVHYDQHSLSLGIYQFEDCTVHPDTASTDHHTYNFDLPPLNKKWDAHGCQCLDFVTYLKKGTRSVLFAPGSKGSMHLLHDAWCAQPREGDHDEYTTKPYIAHAIGPWQYQSAYVCRGPSSSGGGKPAPSAKKHDHGGVVEELKHGVAGEVAKKVVKAGGKVVKTIKGGPGRWLPDWTDTVDGLPVEDVVLDAAAALLL